MKSYEYYYWAKRNMLSDAVNRGRIFGEVKKGQRVHVSAVCGKAMASVACMLQDFGCKVTGSDAEFHLPMSAVLDKHGIKKLPLSEKNIKNIDLLVVGNSQSPLSVEVLEARKRNIPMISGAEAISQISNNKKSLVVAGTHGKTTTSALLTHLFIEAGKDPVYMIGGVFQNNRDSYGFGSKKSKHIIYEGDEYNCAFFDRAPKFLRYNASSIILTSIEHDHFDLYPSFEDYKAAFQFLIDDLPKKGFAVVNESVLNYINTKNVESKIFTYGVSNKSDAKYKIVKVDSKGTTFNLSIKGYPIFKNIILPMYGEYNVQNATSVFTLALLEGVPENKIRQAFLNFPGTKERQELFGVNSKQATIIRDYAHHPTAVTLTLEGLKLRYPNKRVVSVFEPRSATSRSKIFENDYSNSLLHSDVSIIISPHFKETDKKENFVDVNNISNFLNKSKKEAYGVSNCEEAFSKLVNVVKKDDLVVFMSSGDMDKIPTRFLNI